MGIDFSACHALVIEWDAVRELVPRAADNLLAVLEKYKGQRTAAELRDEMCRSLVEDFGGDDDSLDDEDTGESAEVLRNVLFEQSRDDDLTTRQAGEILAAYGQLREEFRKNTTVGASSLQLYAGYHDSQNQGCRGDEIDGAYFHVEGAQQLTPAGEKFRDRFELKTYTAWG